LPRPLHTVLLEATFPCSLNILWTYLLSGNSSELAEFHRNLGDVDITLSPWRKHSSSGQRTRVIQFIVPLKNPLGPKQASNREELTISHLEARTFIINATATSTGVPFATAFENHVQWIAKEERPGVTRLSITGECKFKAPVWGPLKGTINSESIKGMSRAYLTLESMLATKFGISSSLTPNSTAKSLIPGATDIATTMNGLNLPNTTDNEGFLSFLQSPQSNPAVLIALIAMFIILWRMALLNAMTLHMFQRLATKS
jgi:VAD1 Analog of StAR-related lipid transfer domain